MQRSIGLSMALAMVAVWPAAASAQTLPPPKSDWVIEYRGKVTATPNGSWDKPTWQTGTPNVYASSGGGRNGLLQGGVEVRARWVGTGPAPTKVNLAITSSVGGFGNGSFSTSDPWESKSGSGGASVGRKRLVQLAGSGAVFSYSCTASATGSRNVFPTYNLTMSLSATVDPRACAIATAGLPDEYYVKGPDMDSEPLTVQDILWKGPRTLPLPNEPEVRAKINVPVLQSPVINVAPSYETYRLVGLPTGVREMISETASIERRGNRLNYYFIGLATTDHKAGERFTFSSMPGWSTSGTLPLNGNIWAIGGLPYQTARGQSVLWPGGSVDPRSDESCVAKLQYTWVDGLVADATANLVFMDEFSNHRTAQMREVRKGEVRELPFVSGPADLFPVEFTNWDGGRAKTVRFSWSETTYQAAAVTVALIGAAMIGPEVALAGMLTTMAGITMSVGNPYVSHDDITPVNPFELITDDSPVPGNPKYRRDEVVLEGGLVLVKRDFTEEIWTAIESITDPAERANTGGMQWKLAVMPSYDYALIFSDQYGPGGFMGVRRTQSYEYQRYFPMQERGKRWTFVNLGAVCR